MSIRNTSMVDAKGALSSANYRITKTREAIHTAAKRLESTRRALERAERDLVSAQANRLSALKDLVKAEEDQADFFIKSPWADDPSLERGVDSEGRYYEITCDEHGEILLYRRADGHISARTRDAKGNELTYDDSEGHSCTYGYNDNDSLLWAEHGDGGRYEYERNQAGAVDFIREVKSIVNRQPVCFPAAWGAKRPEEDRFSAGWAAKMLERNLEWLDKPLSKMLPPSGVVMGTAAYIKVDTWQGGG
jgi:hypothetical protein